MRAPVLGGNFGVWGGLFSTFDCAVKGVRKKEDPYNAIIAGFFTGGSLAVRGGYKAARNGAIGCAVLLAVIEGVGIAFQKMMAGSTRLEVGVFSSLLIFISLFLCPARHCILGRSGDGSFLLPPGRSRYGMSNVADSSLS